MALSERLAYILDFDVKGAVKGLEKVGSTADRELGKAERKLDKLGGNLTKFGAGAVAFAGVAGLALLKTGGAASDLGESINAVEVTFGDAAAGILKLGEEAATAVGMSRTEFNGLAVQFSSFATTVAGEGGDVVGTMADMTTRAADFASVMNIEVADAARMFQSGLAGETEPLKKFGLDLSAAAVQLYAVESGLIDSGAAMTESEKVTARYGLLMEQTAKTQGDFANTSDSFANQQRILKAELSNLSAEIGQSVLPMMTKFAGAALKVTQGLSKLNSASGGAVSKFAMVGTAGIGLLGTLSLVAGQVIKMRDRFTTLGDNGVRSLNGMGRAAKGLAIALGVAAVAMALYSANQAANQAQLQGSIEIFEELGRTADNELAHGLTLALWQAKAGGQDLDEAMASLARSNIEVAQRLIETGAAADVSAEAEAALIIAIENEEKARAQGIKTGEDYTRQLEDGVRVTEDATRKSAMRKKALDEEKRSTDKSTTAIRRQRRINRELTEQYGDLTPAIEEATDATDDLAESVTEAQQAFQDLRGEIDQRQAWRDLETTMADLQTAAEESWEAASSGAEDAAEKAIAYQVQQDITAENLLDYLESLEGVPDDVTTGVIALIAEEEFAEVERRLAVLTAQRNLRVVVSTAGVNINTIDRGSGQVADPVKVLPKLPLDFPGLAEGGIVRSRPGGTPVIIGEGGSDEAVIPLNKAGGGLGGVTYNIHVSAGMGADGTNIGKQVVSAIKQYERTNGTRWRQT